VGQDAATDVAVIQINSKGDLPTLPLGDSDALRVGDWAIAVGNPLGELQGTVTAGIISAKGRSALNIMGGGPDYQDFIQTDAAINFGNSGGPLLNIRGEVVGINTAIIPNGQGIGFAVPVNMAKSLLPQLEKSGHVTRGYLGVGIQTITPELAKSLGLKDEKGALVADVKKGSPGEAAGLKPGDVITRFDGKDVSEVRMLPTLVAETPVGKEVPLTILRDGKEQILQVKVAEMPGQQAEASSPSSQAPAQNKWGLAVRDLDPQTASRLGVTPGGGVLVVGVQPGSAAERAGLQAGDVIQEVNKEKVTSVKELQAAAQKTQDNGSLLLLVRRGDASLFAALELKQG